MNPEDNKFNDTTRNTKPEANTPEGKKVENKDSETLKTEKTDTKEQIGKAVDNIKPYAAKAWSFTKDLADYIKEKAPDFVDAAKKGLQEAQDTVKDAYDKFQKHRDEKAKTPSSNTPSETKTTVTSTTTSNDKQDSPKGTTTGTPNNPNTPKPGSDTINKPKH